MSIKYLQIKNFRNHADFAVESQAKFINIIGNNGVGKTNVLEAVSLLAPGKGLRGVKFEEIVNSSSGAKYWAINCEVHSENDFNRLKTNFSSGERRCVIANETNLRSSSGLLDYLRVVWLTPKLDGIFGESSGSRRRFFDRICYNIYPTHASKMLRLEKAIRSRNRVLKDNPQDDFWLSAYERVIAEESVNITQTRQIVVNYLQKSLANFQSSFLKPDLGLKCFISDLIGGSGVESASAIELKLREARVKDRITGKCSIGAHKAEVLIKHPQSNLSAALCSTGEQKAMVISTLIAHLKCIETTFNGSLILLLDDIFSHLDDVRKEELVKELSFSKSQTWITSTDDFSPLFMDRDSMKVFL